MFWFKDLKFIYWRVKNTYVNKTTNLLIVVEITVKILTTIAHLKEDCVVCISYGCVAAVLQYSTNAILDCFRSHVWSRSCYSLMIHICILAAVNFCDPALILRMISWVWFWSSNLLLSFVNENFILSKGAVWRVGSAPVSLLCGLTDRLVVKKEILTDWGKHLVGHVQGISFVSKLFVESSFWSLSDESNC